MPSRTCFQQQRPSEASIFVALDASRTCIFSRPTQLSFVRPLTGNIVFWRRGRRGSPSRPRHKPQGRPHRHKASYWQQAEQHHWMTEATGLQCWQQDVLPLAAQEHAVCGAANGMRFQRCPEGEDAVCWKHAIPAEVSAAIARRTVQRPGICVPTLDFGGSTGHGAGA